MKMSFKKIARVILTSLCILLIGVAGLMYWAVGRSLPTESDLPISKIPSAVATPPKETLTIMTYNVAHGQGIKVDPTDWRDKAYTEKKLEEMAQVLIKESADIVLLQEVDIDADRSHHIDQAEYLVKQAKYPYYACATVWDKNYLPFPFWPPQFHLGKMNSAICILSRYPLKDHKRIVFDKPDANPFWYNWGYIDRAAQRVVATIGKRDLTIINTHLEAFDKATREKQAKVLIRWMSDLEGPVVLGGDFNSVPPEATKKSGFIDSPNEEYVNERTIEFIRAGLGNYTEAISPQNYRVNESTVMTFPSDNPTRMLDHLFALKGARIVEGRVIREAGDASDHLPVWARVHYRW